MSARHRLMRRLGRVLAGCLAAVLLYGFGYCRELAISIVRRPLLLRAVTLLAEEDQRLPEVKTPDRLEIRTDPPADQRVPARRHACGGPAPAGAVSA